MLGDRCVSVGDMTSAWRRIHESVILLTTALFLVFVIAQAAPAPVLVTALAALAIAAAIGARYATALLGAHNITVGARARRHRDSLTEQPEPQHPDTAGRPRTRAPSRPFAAA